MLISCAAYQDGRKLEDIAIARIPEFLQRPNCFVWVALHDPPAAELTELQKIFGLHALAVEDAQAGRQRPKIEEYGDSLFALLQIVEPHEDEFQVGELAIFAGRNYVLSVRNRSSQGFLGVRERCEREPELLSGGSGFVLYALMDAVVDRYFPIIDRLEDELEAIERQIFTEGAGRANIKHLYELKQRVMAVKHAVAPLLEGAGKLYGGRVPQICVRSQEYFRDVADHLGRINSSVDTIRDTISTAISVNLSMVTIEDSEITKRLAAWAAIFAVCTAFAGIWGMNFEHMPELKWDYGYVIALTLIICTCSYLYYRFRRAGWL